MKKHLASLLAALFFASPAVAQTINNLGAGAAVSGTDMFPSYQGANPAKRVTAAQINTYVQSLWGAGCATFLTTPSSANLRACLTDEVGTGAFYTIGGALGTPASATLTNGTGLPISTGLTGAGTGVLTALAAAMNSSAGPIGALTPTNNNCVVGNGTAWTSASCPASAGGAIQPVSGVSSTVPGMTAGAALADTDLFYASQSSGTNDRKVTGAQVKTYANTSAVNPQTGTTYTVLNTDQNKLVTLSNAAAVTVTLPDPSGGNFAAGWAVSFRNLGAGTVTINRGTSSTIDGATSAILLPGQGFDLYSDGTNYFTQPGKGGTGTVSTTGSPANGNLTKFSGASSITNGDLAGDCTTSGALTTTCAGDHPGYVSGSWYAPLPEPLLAGGTAHNANRIGCTFVAVPRLVTINSLGAGIGTAGTTNVQFAIYANSASGRPSTLIANTGNISNAVSANTQVSGALAANKQVGPGGADGGKYLWFCSNQNDSTATYAVQQNGNYFIAAFAGDATLSNIIYGPANNAPNGYYCDGAACQGGSSTFGSWPANLSTTTWSIASPGTSGSFIPRIFFKAN